jgi:hypothetical protein
MTPGDRKRFAQALEAMATLYDQELTNPLRDLWWKLCQDITIEQFTQALEKHARESRFMPKPADVLARITGTQDDRAAQAWLKVLDAIRQHGSWRAVAFTDPLIVPAVKAIGGWQQLCLTPTQDLHWKERAFRERYTLFEDQPPHAPGGYLAAASDAHNQAIGHPVQKPVLVDAPGTPLVEHQGAESPQDSERMAKAMQGLARSLRPPGGGGG